MYLYVMMNTYTKVSDVADGNDPSRIIKTVRFIIKRDGNMIQWFRFIIISDPSEDAKIHCSGGNESALLEMVLVMF